MDSWLIYLLVVTVLFQLVIAYKLRQRLGQVKHDNEQQLNALHKEIEALLTANTGLGERFRLMEQQMRSLDDRQEQLEWTETSGQSLKHAVSLVKKGADVDELVTTCGISRGEAELLMTVHQIENAT